MATHFSCASSAAEPLKFPNWQDLYHAAVLEIDRPKLLKCDRLPRLQFSKGWNFYLPL
jgi:hypothetical protein